MSKWSANNMTGSTRLSPQVAIDTEAGRLNKGEPDIGVIACQLPDWDLLPPDNLVRRGN